MVCVFLLFQLTIGSEIRKLNNEIEKIKSKENVEMIKNKLRKELKNAVNKEQYLSPEDAKLIKEFLNKIDKELSN